MATFSNLFGAISIISLVLTLQLACFASAQLSPDFYATTCPNLRGIVRVAMREAIDRELRLGASILRLFFHDCFVNGCDASILLDETPTFTGEKNALPNRNSARGFEVIDTIKTRVEAACSNTVSCADILAIAARDGVVLVTRRTNMGSSTGPERRDNRKPSRRKHPNPLPILRPPGPHLRLRRQRPTSAHDMTALSGGHTIGFARCTTFRSRIYNDTNIDPNFAARRRTTCPSFAGGSGDDSLAPLDIQTPNRFGNDYYVDLLNRRGLLHSDQELFNGGSQDGLVRAYSGNQNAFYRDFADAMVKMGNISPLTGINGQIRRNCRVVN
ncbi:hypothetical protein Vadar_028789 [Vaccinium darrowii]|uniref:Uncharacterized protein n=1 Tax=Vaccinium darrowii TaxID=229202 RepID=A0ACB7XVM1_9ERIC|nr:hypothetical protein Vadar_028789 [Vaccinium darrowii]